MYALRSHARVWLSPRRSRLLDVIALAKEIELHARSRQEPACACASCLHSQLHHTPVSRLTKPSSKRLSTPSLRSRTSSKQHKPTVPPNKSARRYPRVPPTPQRVRRRSRSCTYPTSWWRRFSTQGRARRSAQARRAFRAQRDTFQACSRAQVKRRPC
jgi:hypothetical protein